MGNTKGAALSQLGSQQRVSSDKFQVQHWKPLSPTEIHRNSLTKKQEYGFYSTFQNKFTAQMVDRYEIICPSEQQFNNYIESFVWRLRQQHLVNALFLEEKPKQLCSYQWKAHIYISHMPLRLDEITDIPYPYELTILLGALKGYQKLFQHVGYFKVKQEQICIDNQGIVRVWINSDLSKNYPDNGNFVHIDGTASESQMVEEILQIVFKNVDENSQPQSLQRFVHERLKESSDKMYSKYSFKKKISFEQVEEILNLYIETYNTETPESFATILQLMRDNNSERNTYTMSNQSTYSPVQRNERSEKANIKTKNSVSFCSEGNSFNKGYIQGLLQSNSHSRSNSKRYDSKSQSRSNSRRNDSNSFARDMISSKSPDEYSENVVVRQANSEQKFSELLKITPRHSDDGFEYRRENRTRSFQLPHPIQTSFSNSQSGVALKISPQQSAISERQAFRNADQSRGSRSNCCTDRSQFLSNGVQADALSTTFGNSANFPHTHCNRQGMPISNFHRVPQPQILDMMPARIQFFVHNNLSTTHQRRFNNIQSYRPPSPQFLFRKSQLKEKVYEPRQMPSQVTEGPSSKQQSEAQIKNQEQAEQEAPIQHSPLTFAKKVAFQTPFLKKLKSDISESPTQNDGERRFTNESNNDDLSYNQLSIENKLRRNTLLSGILDNSNIQQRIQESRVEQTMMIMESNNGWVHKLPFREQKQPERASEHQVRQRAKKFVNSIQSSSSINSGGLSNIESADLRAKMSTNFPEESGCFDRRSVLRHMNQSEPSGGFMRAGRKGSLEQQSRKNLNYLSVFLDPQIMQDLMAMQTMEEL